MSETTVGEALREANATLTSESRQSDKSDRSESKETSEKHEAVDDDDFGAPGWTKQWKKNSREALRKLARMEGSDPEAWKQVYSEIEDRYDYTGKQQAEFNKYRQRWDQYDAVISPLEQQSAFMGMSPVTALQQMSAVSNLLRQDPDQALMWLAQQFGPRDAKAFVQNLSKHFQVDLGQLAASAPWVDPVIEQRLRPLEQANQQAAQLMQQAFAQQQHFYQQQYQNAAHSIADSIKAFKETADENGNIKYPYYDALEPYMTELVRTQGPKPLEELYELAMEKLSGPLSERAKQAEQAAKDEVVRQNASVEKAMGASRNVSGSKTSAKSNPVNLRQLIEQESKRLSR